MQAKHKHFERAKKKNTSSCRCCIDANFVYFVYIVDTCEKLVCPREMGIVSNTVFVFAFSRRDYTVSHRYFYTRVLFLFYL